MCVFLILLSLPGCFRITTRFALACHFYFPGIARALTIQLLIVPFFIFFAGQQFIDSWYKFMEHKLAASRNALGQKRKRRTLHDGGTKCALSHLSVISVMQPLFSVF